MQFLKKVRQDTSLLADIDIGELTQKIVNSEKHDYLDNKTLSDIIDANINAIKRTKTTQRKYQGYM